MDVVVGGGLQGLGVVHTLLTVSIISIDFCLGRLFAFLFVSFRNLLSFLLAAPLCCIARYVVTYFNSVLLLRPLCIHHAGDLSSHLEIITSVHRTLPESREFVLSFCVFCHIYNILSKSNILHH